DFPSWLVTLQRNPNQESVDQISIDAHYNQTPFVGLPITPVSIVTAFGKPCVSHTVEGHAVTDFDYSGMTVELDTEGTRLDYHTPIRGITLSDWVCAPSYSFIDLPWRGFASYKQYELAFLSEFDK